MNDPDEADAIGTAVLDQIKRQGCGCVRVSDGQAFFFTREFLETMLVKAIENVDDEMVMVLVKRGPEA